MCDASQFADVLKSLLMSGDDRRQMNSLPRSVVEFTGLNVRSL